MFSEFSIHDRNSHERDSHIIFDEEPHIYTIDGDSNYTSVTTLCHSQFNKFDADLIINKMMNSRYWYKTKYYGKTVEEIKNEWEINRNNAAMMGTKMHNDIECYYNNIQYQNNSVEFQYFLNFVNDHPKLKPFRTEWMIWDKELKLAGSIDMVYMNDDNTFSIYDWKRCKKIIRNKYLEDYSNTECLSHIPNTNFWHYSLQLNIYKYIIEKNYGLKIKELCLICLHPDNNNKNYIKINVPNLETEINDLMNYRINNTLLKTI